MKGKVKKNKAMEDVFGAVPVGLYPRPASLGMLSAKPGPCYP